jgi:hypothetical protein
VSWLRIPVPASGIGARLRDCARRGRNRRPEWAARGAGGAVETFHRIEGFAITGGWLVLLLWGIVLFIIKKDAARPYWWLLTALQVLIGVQLLAGLILFAMGGRPPLLHYFYGVVFPAVVLGAAHWLTRSLEKPPYHIFFTIGSFFIFGLTLRALMTGLGIG